MKEGSTILDQLKKGGKELYSAPEGYFEAFPQQMLEKVKHLDSNVGEERIKEDQDIEIEAKVTPFRKRLFSYAVAAVLLVLVGLGGWLWMSKKDVGSPLTAQIDSSLLQKIGNISDSSIEAYMINSALLATNNDKVSSYSLDFVQDLNKEAVSLMLADIPDEALQQYLSM